MAQEQGLEEWRLYGLGQCGKGDREEKGVRPCKGWGNRLDRQVDQTKELGRHLETEGALSSS